MKDIVASQAPKLAFAEEWRSLLGRLIDIMAVRHAVPDQASTSVVELNGRK